MRYRIEQLRLPLEYTDKSIRQRIARHCKVSPGMIDEVELIRRAIDARKAPVYTVSVDFTTMKPLSPKTQGVSEVEKRAPLPAVPQVSTPKRPVVVGAGPAGLSAAWYLAQAGLQPILIERGEEAYPRNKKVQAFWRKDELDEESNVLFGEGGAGLFSDGKLTCRSKEKVRVRQFLQILVDGGASSDILLDKLPHIGSDQLMKIVPNIREQIKQLGGEVRFSCRLDDVEITDGAITAVTTSTGRIETDTVLLGVGHSARDTYAMLLERGVTMVPKPFAIGVRLELPQDHINHCRYRNYTPALGSAEFRLTRKPEGELRSCYSFCMCPGGIVVSCASEPGMLTSNGMSFSRQDLPSGNAAFLVPVSPADFADDYPDNPLGGVEFQRELEKRAYDLAGGYALPASSLVDYLNDVEPAPLEGYSSPHRTVPVNLNKLLPDVVNKTLHGAIPEMLKQLGSPDLSVVKLYGPEMRSSAPVQMSRDEVGESKSTKGLFPVGEGAGYAGGIVSSGIDGLKAAMEVVERLKG